MENIIDAGTLTSREVVALADFANDMLIHQGTYPVDFTFSREIDGDYVDFSVDPISLELMLNDMGFTNMAHSLMKKDELDELVKLTAEERLIQDNSNIGINTHVEFDNNMQAWIPITPFALSYESTFIRCFRILHSGEVELELNNSRKETFNDVRILFQVSIWKCELVA